MKSAVTVQSIAILAIAVAAASALFCEPKPKVKKETIGGQEISQETEKILTRDGMCLRILKGGTRSAYIEAKTCSTCQHPRGGQLSCVKAPVPEVRRCSQVLGPDCKLHRASKTDARLPCERKYGRPYD